MNSCVRRETDPHVCVAELEGDIDMSTVPAIRDDIQAAITSGCHHIVIDLSAVTYADSSALGLLVWLDRELTPMDGRLVLAGARRDVARILELSGLISVGRTISASVDVEAAIEGLELTDRVSPIVWSRTLTMASDVDDLAGMRARVCEIAAPLKFSEAALFDIKVAVGEALANAIRHGSRDANDEISIDIHAYDDRIVIEISDMGAGFDGVHYGDDDPYASGGRGIMFMRALMDKVEFSAGEHGGTVVSLVKHRAPE